MSLLHNKMYSVTEDINKHTLYTSSFYVTLLRKAKGEKKGQSTLWFQREQKPLGKCTEICVTGYVKSSFSISYHCMIDSDYCDNFQAFYLSLSRSHKMAAWINCTLSPFKWACASLFPIFPTYSYSSPEPQQRFPRPRSVLDPKISPRWNNEGLLTGHCSNALIGAAREEARSRKRGWKWPWHEEGGLQTHNWNRRLLR